MKKQSLIIGIIALILVGCNKSSTIENTVKTQDFNFKTAINDHPQYAVHVPALNGYYLGDSISIDDYSLNKSISIKGNTQFVSDDIIDTIIPDGPIPETLSPCASGVLYGITFYIYCGELNTAYTGGSEIFLGCLGSTGVCFALPLNLVFVF